MEDGYPKPLENCNITGYLGIGDGEGGNAVCNTFGDTPFTKELIYAPGTEIVNNKIYYTLENIMVKMHHLKWILQM